MTPAELAQAQGGQWPSHRFDISPQQAGTAAFATQEKYNVSADAAEIVLKLMWRGGLQRFNDLAAEYERQGRPRPSHDGGLYKWLSGISHGSQDLREEALQVAARRCVDVVPAVHAHYRNIAGQLPVGPLMLNGDPVQPAGLSLGHGGVLQLTVLNLFTGQLILSDPPPVRQPRRELPNVIEFRRGFAA